MRARQLRIRAAHAAVVLAIATGGCGTAERRAAEARADSLQRTLQRQQDSLKVASEKMTQATQAAADKRRGDSLKAARRQTVAESVKKTQAESAQAELSRPKSLALLDASAIEIPVRDWRDYRFALDGTGDCRLEGHVLGLAGGRKDVEVYVLTDDDFINWKGRQSGFPKSAPLNMGLFHSERQISTSVSLPVQGRGTFHLVISNSFSASATKTVQARASVTCVGGSAPQAVQ